jgi:hypothetical protein
MTIRRVVQFLLIASLVPAAPAAGQWIPDYSPEEPLADWHKERMIERYRSVLGRMFADGGFAFGPFGGPAYQVNMALGMTLPAGDAVFVTAAVRGAAPEPDMARAGTGLNDGAGILGLGYEMRGTRAFGDTPLGWRTGLGLGVGVLTSMDLVAATFDITPTYDLVVRHDLAVPVGLRFSVSNLVGGDTGPSLTRSFVGLHVGGRWHLATRKRLD